jgi:dienelactone hydrolase
MLRLSHVALLLALSPVLLFNTPAFAQPAKPAGAKRIQAETKALQAAVDAFKAKNAALEKQGKDGTDPRLIADVEVFPKAADWILRHAEFYKPSYVAQTFKALQIGRDRLKELTSAKAGKPVAPSWTTTTGTTIRGYVSQVDGSVQPYAITLPKGVNPKAGKRWPLHLKLHGRAGQMNEVDFIRRHEGKPVPKEQTWIQLDVFGRTNNAFRWSGETDVFEALADVQRRFRIDRQRITLWGFSMGGAGAWHLGLHHPSKWSSVGPGAGFVDFYNYQKVTKKLPDYQHRALRIYDAVGYALNAYDVPVCTYGGENDAQLVASTATVAVAKRLGVEIKLLIGPGVGHKFHPDTYKEFMAFHLDKAATGRKRYPGQRDIRFMTYTLKYNQCEWLTIEEMETPYKPAIVTASIDKQTGDLKLTTRNIGVMQIGRDVAQNIVIDGKKLRLADAAESLLPGVYFEKGDKDWVTIDYQTSRNFTSNPNLQKRHDLQGPIDDAFMKKFVCVQGTGKAWSAENDAWAKWTLSRFEKNFDKWLRGKVPVVKDSELTSEMIANSNIVLFGDPGSNSVLAKVIADLPVKWTKKGIEVAGKTYDPKSHGLSLIYPNPLNKQKYVVINSGHTFQEDAFKASNSWLFPRLGDIAVQKFEKDAKTAGYTETVQWADIFDSGWQLPVTKPKAE